MYNSAIFAAADVSTVSSSVSTLLVGLVGIALLFTAYRYLRKSGVR